MHQPTHDLQAKLARIRLVLMDIDGTLVTSPLDVFGNVAGQLRRLRRFSVPFSLATGRTVAGSRDVVERLRTEVGVRMPPVIVYNGAVMLSADSGGIVERHLLDRSSVFKAVSACRQLGLWPLVYSCVDTLSGPPRETVFIDHDAPASAEFNGMGTIRVKDVANLEGGDVVAILADAGGPDASGATAAWLTSAFGDELRATTSGSRYVEICSPLASKLTAMRRLTMLHNLSEDEVMAIGDNVNDLEMIREAGVGIAVGNAPDEVKAVADYACIQTSAYGVVEALRMLVGVLRERDKGNREWSCKVPEQTSASAPMRFSANASSATVGSVRS